MEYSRYKYGIVVHNKESFWKCFERLSQASGITSNDSERATWIRIVRDNFDSPRLLVATTDSIYYDTNPDRVSEYLAGGMVLLDDYNYNNGVFRI